MNKNSNYKATDESDLEDKSEQFNLEYLDIEADSKSYLGCKERLDKSKLCTKIIMDQEELNY